MKKRLPPRSHSVVQATLWASLALVGCGGSGGTAQDAGDVTCPAGQTYDGQFCQVDQNVATAEQPIAGAEEETSAMEIPDEPGQNGEEPTEQHGGGEDGSEEQSSPEKPEGEEPAPPQMAAPVDVTMAAQAGPMIQYLASAHLPSGARQLGAPFAGQFAEGQILEQKVQLTKGKCYTVLAASLPPVSEVDLELFVEGEKEPVVSDETTGSQAVLGARANCFQPSESGLYRLVLKVMKGQGLAAAQVFQK